MLDSKIENKIKIIFMGTPDFAVPALNALHKNNYNVVLVVTQPDRPKGRSRKPAFPPVKKAAIHLGYDVIQPISIKTDEFANHIIELKPDIFVVSAFGHILPKRILGLPTIGALNIHASLLPEYRGAAPIQWAVINGEKETGVTAMLMDEGMDTGDILFTSKTEIFPDDTSATLHDRLADLGAGLLIKTLKVIAAGNINPISQDHTRATYAPMLKKKDGHIDWEMAADKLEAFIRGMTPWPGAFTFYNNTRLKIFRSTPVTMSADNPPGTVLKAFPDELCVATGKGTLSILEIQGESGKRLVIKDFLRGFKLPVGTVLE
ncbi:MAG: methionyl-tRNA formyltransferase [Deltaproteobacteria bacterium]|nr:methionyl-tRNA formyltransferase [Deltaproteobacteria bacterium]MBW2661964.1 methionyl-tRNA formyltransferase [Deltaproteobacteria bacterium]